MCVPKSSKRHHCHQGKCQCSHHCECLLHNHLCKVRGEFESHRESIVFNLSNCITMMQSSRFHSSSLKVWYCIEMSSLVKNLTRYLVQHICYLMIGKGYCLHMMAVLSKQESVISWTHPSVLETMKTGDTHSEALHGSTIPSSTMRLSYIFKVW